MVVLSFLKEIVNGYLPITLELPDVYFEGELRVVKGIGWYEGQVGQVLTRQGFSILDRTERMRSFINGEDSDARAYLIRRTARIPEGLENVSWSYLTLEGVNPDLSKRIEEELSRQF
jgi:hypothetical protein